MEDPDPKTADRILKELLKLPEPRRAGFLAEACTDTPALEALVRRLLAHALADDRQLAGAGLEWLAVETDDFAPRLREAVDPGDRIGPFRLERVLGRGGTATVYLARRDDGQFEQQVAVKILHRGTGMPARFEQERQILAALDHPNIARLLDGGVTEQGVPYVVMEYIEGTPLSDYCEERRLPIGDRLRLFRHVVDAVGDAHGKLIVHRDIKSANILVTEGGVPKLLDFGIAKLLQSDAIPHAAPETRALKPMTPEYASPEQVRGEPLGIATDIYQLGYLLYELLTGQSPYDVRQTDLVALLTAIAESAAISPSRRIATVDAEPEDAPWHRRGTTRRGLEKQLRGDLDRVVLKALHKDPAQRYATAAEFATDIDAVLDRRPVSARTDSFGYRGTMFVRRHAVAVGTATAVFAGIVAGLALFTLRLADERQRAELEANKAREVTEFLMELFAASDPRESGAKPLTARELLARGVENAEALNEQADVQAEMMEVLGQIYIELGEYRTARQLLTRALDSRRSSPDAGDGELLSSLLSMSRLLLRTGDYEGAEALYREALELHEQTSDAQNLETASILNGLGNAVASQGRLEPAREVAERALAIREAILGKSHPDVAASLNNVGLIAMEQGDYDAAEAMHRRALDMRRGLFGREHLDITYSLNNLALVYHERGEYELAEPLYRELVAMDRKILGDEHPEVAMDLNNLAGLLSDTGRHEEAQPLHEQALRIRREKLGPDHPLVGQSMHNLAWLYLRQDDFEQSEALFRDALSLRRAAYGEKHPEVANTLYGLAGLLTEIEEYEEAESLYRQALSMRRELLGDSHPDVARSLWGIGTLYRRRNRFNIAEAHFLEALQVVDDTGASGNTNAMIRESLVELYIAWGRPDDAIRYRSDPHPPGQ